MICNVYYIPFHLSSNIQSVLNLSSYRKSDRNMNMVDFKLLNKYQYLLYNLIYLLSKNPFGLKQYTLQTNKKTIKEIYYIYNIYLESYIVYIFFESLVFFVYHPVSINS
jgi:hypothetical protein